MVDLAFKVLRDNRIDADGWTDEKRCNEALEKYPAQMLSKDVPRMFAFPAEEAEDHISEIETRLKLANASTVVTVPDMVDSNGRAVEIAVKHADLIAHAVKACTKNNTKPWVVVAKEILKGVRPSEDQVKVVWQLLRKAWTDGNHQYITFQASSENPKGSRKRKAQQREGAEGTNDGAQVAVAVSPRLAALEVRGQEEDGAGPIPALEIVAVNGVAVEEQRAEETPAVLSPRQSSRSRTSNIRLKPLGETSNAAQERPASAIPPNQRARSAPAADTAAVQRTFADFADLIASGAARFRSTMLKLDELLAHPEIAKEIIKAMDAEVSDLEKEVAVEREKCLNVEQEMGHLLAEARVLAPHLESF